MYIYAPLVDCDGLPPSAHDVRDDYQSDDSEGDLEAGYQASALGCSDGRVADLDGNRSIFARQVSAGRVEVKVVVA